MSFLMEVLSSVEESEIETSKKNIPLLLEHISKCKEETTQYLEDVYVKYEKCPKQNKQLVSTTTQLSQDISDLHNRIEQVTMKDFTKKIGEVETLTADLQQAMITVKILSDIVKVNELVVEVQTLQQREMYSECGDKFCEMDKYFEDIPGEEATEALEALKVKVLDEKSLFVANITEMVKDHIQLTQTSSDITDKKIIKIRKGDVLELVTILYKFDRMDTLEELVIFLCECVKEVVVKTTAVKLDSTDDFNVLVVAVKKTKSKILHSDVFVKLIEVFLFLQSYFNYQVGSSTTIEIIGNPVIDCLIKNMESTLEDPSLDYKKLIEDVQEFQNKLVTLKILHEDSSPLLVYIDNLNATFTNKKCQSYLELALSAMKKDLHELVVVGGAHSQDGANPLNEFPECSVSRSVLEILNILTRILEQALTESDPVAVSLINTAQNVCSQYGSTVSKHHSKLLHTIPQQVALFRNNCMYIAHRLSHLNEEFGGKFPAAVLPSEPLFTDQGLHLHLVGNEIFSAYVEEQMQVIDNTLREFDFDSLHISNKLHPDVDKCIRQCMRQQELLKTVWFKILPYSVYNKTLGHLLHSFCKKLVDAVVKTEDITTTNAETLIELYKVVQNRGPKLFTDPHEINLHVEGWQRFCDIIFVLGASLVEICDKWSEGKGPLTLTFAAEEVRGLIKALFQNTERRTTALKKIHN